MQIWTVANQKGGVGKTTSSVALAGLAAEQGNRVLLIDLDPHGSMTSYFGHNPDDIELSVFTLFDDKKAICIDRINEILQPTSFKNMTLLPSSTALATLERRAIGKDGLGLVITKTLKQLDNEFDLVIIDCPPVLGVLLINALAACNHLVVPVQTEFLAIKGLERMVHTLRMLGQSQHHSLDYVIVPTMFDRRTQASVTSLSAIRHEYGADTWPGKVPIDTRFRDASKAGVPPHLYDPESKGITAYRSLYNWLVKHSKNQANTRYWKASESIPPSAEAESTVVDPNTLSSNSSSITHPTAQ